MAPRQGSGGERPDQSPSCPSSFREMAVVSITDSCRSMLFGVARRPARLMENPPSPIFCGRKCSRCSRLRIQPYAMAGCDSYAQITKTICDIGISE